VRRLGVGRLAVVPRPQGSGKTHGVLENFKMQTINNPQIARSVRFDIATDKNEEFHTLFRNEVLPMLKKQDGFKNELLLVHDQHVLAISVWNNADAAGKYESVTYPQVDKTLRPVMIGKPTVETFQYDSLSTI
jgi:heme-degrading monooxygenase HmoA